MVFLELMNYTIKAISPNETIYLIICFKFRATLSEVHVKKKKSQERNTTALDIEKYMNTTLKYYNLLQIHTLLDIIADKYDFLTENNNTQPTRRRKKHTEGLH